MKHIKCAILGASGYTGVELIRLLAVHPQVEIALLTGDSQAGKTMAEVYPHLSALTLPPLIKIEAVDFSKVDVVFCCLPHGTTQEVIAALPKTVKVIDLSADFRLSDLTEYAAWYGHAHRAPELQKEAVYGLTEHARAEVKTARLVANPGCYPTASQLPLIPLLQQKVISAENIIIDAKSGTSGAGRSAKISTLYCEVNESVAAYGIGAHRHTPEIEQGLSVAAGGEVKVSFTPHLIPMQRGILATIYAELAPGKTLADARAVLTKAYGAEPFVHVLAEGVAPSTAMARGSNHCFMNVFADRRPGRIILISAIDNLVKGASGQAVQNLNVMMGWDETLGLQELGVVP